MRRDPIRVNDTLSNGAGGNWGFGQNRQERKCAIKLNIVVDVIGQYVLNGRGEERERGERSEGRRGRMRRSWDEERRGEQ